MKILGITFTFGNVVAIITTLIGLATFLFKLHKKKKEDQHLGLSVKKLKKEVYNLESADIRIKLEAKEYYSNGKRFNHTFKFIIENVGNSPARNVDILDAEFLKIIDQNWHGNRVKSPKPIFPIPIIKNGAANSFYFHPNIIDFLDKYLLVEWVDNNGALIKENIYVQIIDIDVTS